MSIRNRYGWTTTLHGYGMYTVGSADTIDGCETAARASLTKLGVTDLRGFSFVAFDSIDGERVRTLAPSQVAIRWAT